MKRPCGCANSRASWVVALQAQIVHFLEERLRSCNRTCLVCDAPLEYVSLKPATCSADLCVHGYNQYGLGLDVYNELLTNRRVADLLISVFYAAATSNRIDLCFPNHVSAPAFKTVCVAGGGGNTVIAWLV